MANTCPSSCRWASSSQDSRPDSSRVVYDDVPYEKVQVSRARGLGVSHCYGQATGDALKSLGGLGQPCRSFSTLSYPHCRSRRNWGGRQEPR